MVLKVSPGIFKQAVDTVRIKQTVVQYWTLYILEWPHKSRCNYCLRQRI